MKFNCKSGDFKTLEGGSTVTGNTAESTSAEAGEGGGIYTAFNCPGLVGATSANVSGNMPDEIFPSACG